MFPSHDRSGGGGGQATGAGTGGTGTFGQGNNGGTSSAGASIGAAGGGLTDRTINTQSGTSYTFQLTDAVSNSNTLVQFTSASQVTATIPLNSSVAFPVGTQIDIFLKQTG